MVSVKFIIFKAKINQKIEIGIVIIYCLKNIYCLCQFCKITQIEYVGVIFSHRLKNFGNISKENFAFQLKTENNIDSYSLFFILLIEVNSPCKMLIKLFLSFDFCIENSQWK